MREYQQKYIENTEKTAAILSKNNPEAPDFEAFFCERMQKEQELLRDVINSCEAGSV